MEKKSVPILKVACWSVIVICTLVFVHFCVQTYNMYAQEDGVILAKTTSGSFATNLILSLSERMSIVLMLVFIVLFAINIIQSLNVGEIFNRKNVFLLRILAIYAPCYAFVRDNAWLIYSDQSPTGIAITDAPFFYAVILLIVSQLYKVACDSADEQKLTI